MIESLVRTYAPILIGYIATLLAGLGVTLDATVQATLVAAVAAAYYALARWLESRWPWASWLLGSRSQPLYADSRDVVDAER